MIGIAPGGVPVYSSHYPSADDKELPNRQAYRSSLDDVYMGHKWQCVEFARRWLYLNRGYVFDDIAMAYDIFRLRHVRVIQDERLLPLHSFRNGSARHPEPGCLLIWNEGGEFETTGHVAIVTEVTAEYVRLVEQNVDHHPWPEGQDWSREIRARVSPDGEYWLECSFGDASILGWVVQTDDDTDAEDIVVPDPRLFNIQRRTVPAKRNRVHSWLNIANPDEAAYVEMMGGHKLSSVEADQYTYYGISETAHGELKRATNELHQLFMHATDHVLRDDACLEPFNLPRALWPKIHQSWDNRRNQMITGRFDFAMTEKGLKVYEYNCDSASGHMETGKIQGLWARHADCDEGIDPGAHLHEHLRTAWKRSEVDDVLHIMQDHRDLEETYHALFMQEAMEEAGIKTKIIQGVKGLSWDDAGNVLDPDGLRIRWVWKTWAWETALDQLRAECDEDDEAKVNSVQSGAMRDNPPRLIDVLLRQEIKVYEPFWTLIPSNKAILPVLTAMFPDFPYLLNSAHTLTDSLRAGGYVVKPIVGRGGANISMVDRNQNIVAETGGQFDERDQIYQELFKLPKLGDYHVQVNTFSAAGRYAGACIRVDKTAVINKDSDILALRVLEDEDVVPPSRDA